MNDPASTEQAKVAAKIQKLLAQAEGEAAAGNEAARDVFLEKASALQLKYAIADAMLSVGAQGKDELTHADFCTESNTPLIKAKRQLINGLANENRGHAIMMGEWRDKKAGGRKYDRRAKVRVYAHESDLTFITMLYNSLIIQMQTMMANDEKAEALRVTISGVHSMPQAWRVSYAYGWVARVLGRLREAAERNQAAAEDGQPGTALVLRDRKAVVMAHTADLFGKLKSAGYRVDDKSEEGREAGRRAAERADLGGAKVSSGERNQLGR